METEKNNFALPKIPVIYDNDDDVCTIHQENEPDYVCTIHEENEPDDDDWFPFLSYEDMVEYEIKRLMENENS